jgi:hypothetical protein
VFILTEEKLDSLRIHKLTKDQYLKAIEENKIEHNALYLTPEEPIDLSSYMTKDNAHELFEYKTVADNRE